MTETAKVELRSGVDELKPLTIVHFSACREHCLWDTSGC